MKAPITLLVLSILCLGMSEARSQGLRYRIVGEKPRLNREVMGPVTDEVQGVPAAPIDSFCWDGRGSTRLDSGRIVIDVDPAFNTGTIEAQWEDDYGRWTYSQVGFLHPHHISGVRIASTVSDVDFVVKDSIITNCYLHGDTAAGQPVLPTVFAFLAAWGPAKVTLNGVLFANVYDGPAPFWLAHLMVTHGVRNRDGTVRTIDGEIYHPSQASRGASDPNDIEVHLTWHDQHYPETNNIPPIFSFFYHLVFEKVTLDIVQKEEPIKR